MNDQKNSINLKNIENNNLQTIPPLKNNESEGKLKDNLGQSPDKPQREDEIKNNNNIEIKKNSVR